MFVCVWFSYYNVYYFYFILLNYNFDSLALPPGVIKTDYDAEL